MGNTPTAAWCWEGDHGGWIPYDKAAAATMEKAFQAQKSNVTLRIGSWEYTVDLTTNPFTQENTSTGRRRNVRRIDNTPAQSAATSTTGGWEWEDDSGWKAYSAKDSADLDLARGNGKPTWSMTFGSNTYVVDFAAMTQTNAATGFSRPVRYVAPAAGGTTGGGGGAAASGSAHRSGAGAGAGAGGGGSRRAAAAGPEVLYNEVCDPTTAATAGDATRDSVGRLTGWVHPADFEELKELSCSVCIMDFDEDDDKLTDIVRLGQCNGHYFHVDCIVECFKYSVKCPICSTPYAAMIGRMPKGTMKVTKFPVGRYPLSGHESTGTIVIQYHFPSGTQGEHDPTPGTAYSGTSRTAFLPDIPEGREVAELLVRAFRNRQSFVIGTSVTTGRNNTVVWNGIHHKTNTRGGPTRFGYPDETYFARVKAELEGIGIVPPGDDDGGDDDGGDDDDDDDVAM